MDIFVEQLIRRKRRGIDYIKAALCAFAILIVLLAMPLLMQIPYVGSFALLLLAGVIYLIYNVIISVNIEYEYCFTNGALDIDKIVAARRRKRMTEVNAREIEMMGTTGNHAFRGYMENREIKKVYACSAVDDEGVYFVLYSKGGQKYLLLFNPNDTIKDGFRRLNPQKVFLDD